MVQHDLHARLAGEEVLDDVGLVQPRQHILAVADAVIDEGGMRNLVERRAIGITLQRTDRAVGGEGRDPLDQLLTRLAVGDHVSDRDVLELVGGGEARDLLALHHGAIVVHQLADDADRRQT